MRSNAWWILVGLTLGAGALRGQVHASPVAPVREVRDTYFGTEIVDPYRWMEEPHSAELRGWMQGQASYARAMLDRIPVHDSLVTSLTALANTDAGIETPQRWGHSYFYQRTAAGSDASTLCVRDTVAGAAERVLVDPNALKVGAVHSAISYFYPSPDGKYVAYGLAAGGSEMSVLHVVETASGRGLSDRIEGAVYGSVTWRPDGRSFYYPRLAQLAPHAAPTDKYKRSRNYLHVLGTDPHRDAAMFGYGVSSAVTVGEDDTPIITVSAGSPYAVGELDRGVLAERALYVVRADSLTGDTAPWRKLVDFDDDVTAFAARGDSVYVLTHKGASRYQVLRMSVLHPDLAHAGVVVAQQASVLTGMALAGDGLYVQELDGGPGHLLRVPFTGAPATRVSLPFDGDISELFANVAQPGALFRLQGWTHAPVWLAYDPASARAGDTRIVPPSRVEFNDIVSEEVQVPAADGTLIPLTILYPRGLHLDGSHPALLLAYGAYGVSITPSPSPELIPWFAHGGVWAVAHVRGGGEYGEDWHLAGKGINKQNSIGDFIACAEYLIQRGFTSSAHLGAEGGSAGAIVAGGALTQRPDLLAAVVLQVGVNDMLRIWTTPAGPPNVPEFGLITDPAGFKGLLGMSAYNHVKDKVAYPAVLLTTGSNDPRVAPWQSAKMAARLQAATTSGKPILLRVDYDAGHGSVGSTTSQRVASRADVFTFLLSQLEQPE